MSHFIAFKQMCAAISTIYLALPRTCIETHIALCGNIAGWADGRARLRLSQAILLFKCWRVENQLLVVDDESDNKLRFEHLLLEGGFLDCAFVVNRITN